MLIGSFQLDPEGGAMVRAALDHYGAPRPLRWAVGQDGQVVEVRDVRSKTQRDADALVEICRKALADTDTDPERVGRLPAHVTVTATVEQVAALAEGAPAGLAHCDQVGPVPAAVLARLGCDGVLHRVLRAGSGAVLDVGRAVRCATPGQRKALAVRGLQQAPRRTASRTCRPGEHAPPPRPTPARNPNPTSRTHPDQDPLLPAPPDRTTAGGTLLPATGRAGAAG